MATVNRREFLSPDGGKTTTKRVQQERGRMEVRDAPTVAAVGHLTDVWRGKEAILAAVFLLFYHSPQPLDKL